MRTFIRECKRRIVDAADADLFGVYFGGGDVVIREVEFVYVVGDFVSGVLLGVAMHGLDLQLLTFLLLLYDKLIR